MKAESNSRNVINATKHATKPNQGVGLMLTATSKSEFPYAEGAEFGWQLDMEDSSDKPGKVFSWKVNLRQPATKLPYFLLNLLIPISVAFVYVYVCVGVCVGHI